ncbi:MAG: class I SAM-dependent methyltransferase [Candidatus Acidiferrum sp.]
MFLGSNFNAYDTVPYPSLAFLQTHPDRLAVMATLFGMNPPAVEGCRVLELGCGDGSNLIPMAYGLPGSEFVGVDLAAKPIEHAQQKTRELGLKNIHFEKLDLMDLGPAFGQFGYIIAHGVYAWVPESVQKKILAICHDNLASNGVALVSYNTNPAGHVRQILREMVQFHERRSHVSADRVKSARDFLASILKATDDRSPWKPLFEEESKLAFHRDERVVYHDDLAECFSPASFGDFVASAARCGLQFLSEAQPKEALEPDMPQAALELLSQLAEGDVIAFQQYLDFARHRRFRQTLLCHAEIPLVREKAEERVNKLLVGSPMKVSTKHPDGAVDFVNSRGAGTLTTNNPVVIAGLCRLEEMWPRAERLEDVARAILFSIPEAQRSEVRTGLARAILQLAASALADLRTCNPPFADGVTERPKASDLARLLVKEGSMVTTLFHTHINIEDELGRKFLQLLDGTRDRQALTDALCSGSPDISREAALQQVDQNLLTFYKMGLLVA